MGLDFDLKTFVEDMRACKPPYRCPFDDCGKVYKTFSGIHTHINSHAAGGGSGSRTPNCTSSAGGRGSPVGPTVPCFRSPLKDTLNYNDCEKAVEFETPDGNWHKLDIYQGLEIVSKEDWEASLPESFHKEEAARKAQEEQMKLAAPKTPAVMRHSNTKKGKKGTPRVSKPDPAPPATPIQADENAGDKKHIKLPEAHFMEIDDYEIDDAPPMPISYYRFIEKSSEEQDEEVEYDMDEEDVAWLNIINEKRVADNLAKIHEDQFELLMDRLEKESYFHVQSSGNKDFAAPIDEDAICCVCMDGECSNTNVILFCDLCNLAVHQECYGVPYIPEGQWLCRRCLQSPSRSVECCLCPNRGGAFKQTDDGRWAHVVCGLWIPEVRFANTVFLEPIDSIDNIPPARWKLSCRVCKQRGVGACIQCHKTNCYTAFHVTCGLLAGLHMKMDTVREPSAGGLSVTVRKTAYCDVHTPLDSDCKPKLDDVAALGISTPKQKGRPPKKMPGGSPVPVLFRGLMNFSPQCPWDKVQEIASLINVQRKNQFFQRLMAYWTLKRQTRNGVPLIRRLQFAKATRPDKAPETPQKNAHHSQKKREREKEIAKKAKTEFNEMAEQRRYLRKLRQDLERVRLLCELIRKREQRKRELIVTMSEINELKCMPFIYFMRKVLENLEELDSQDIFAEPVSLEDVPDYLDHIKKPMDIQTMRNKLQSFQYSTFDDLEADFTLMVDNCLSYNERETIFFRAGVKMRNQGGTIIRQAKRMIDSIGFDLKTGLHAAEGGNQKKDDVTDEILMKEIDAYLNDETRDSKPHEEHLKRLLELQDQAPLLHHPVAKVKRMKAIKQEIIKVRRKLAMDKAGTSPGYKPPKTGDGEENSKKKNKGREVSPVSDLVATPVRRLRAGKEIDSGSDTKKPPPKKIPGKRGRQPKNQSDDTPETPTKKVAKEKVAEATPTKRLQNSPAKSPAGVNRRNAVLFTKKKQAATEKPAEDEGKDEPIASPKTVLSSTDDHLAHIESEVRSPEPQDAPQDSKEKSPEKPGKGNNKRRVSSPAKKAEQKEDIPNTAPSFQGYRRGGEMTAETDEGTESESATDGIGTTEEDSEGESESSNDGETSTDQMPLEPLDLVWAKCRGYPWYPALIINPKMPRTGYLHNGVPIPVPPQDVLEMANTHSTPHYLILFFDSKRTWQWLQRDKLEPLGVHSELDKAKLVQPKKAGEKKAVRKAYEDAIVHRREVTGETAAVTTEESSETEDPKDD